MKALALAALLLIAAAPPPAPISAERIKADVRTLSSDDFAGRGPGEPGEAKTVEFIASSFARAGLEPGGENGGWTQDVPLVRLDRLPGATFSVRVAGRMQPLRLATDSTLSLRNAGRFQLADAPLVFAGWGIVDPARGWDAYRGVDMRGKVAVLLANDPDMEAARNLGFGGRALAFAGRSGAKIAAAAKAGAVGVMFIHEEAAFSWPFAQAASGDALPGFAFAPLPQSTLGFSAIVRREIATALLRQAGLALPALKAQARNPRFRAFAMRGTSVSVDGSNRATPFISRNVIGKLRGSEQPDEYLLYGAHWDANGHNGPDPRGDHIRNGAVDNATGTAELIEVARAFAAAKRPRRTVLFAAWTAEEKGLLGAEYYATHPLYPLARTAAVINLDPHVVLPASRSLELIGPGQTDLEVDLRHAAAQGGQRVVPEPNPEAGWYFRSDHYPFVQRGVPALAFRAGRDLIRGGYAAGNRVVATYNRVCYHQPCDQFDPRWTFAGTAQEATAAFHVGQSVANRRDWPQWLKGSEYAPIRGASDGERR
ncbi:MAG: M28 family peptidase [Pseudomonadota bacterium]